MMVSWGEHPSLKLSLIHCMDVASTDCFWIPCAGGSSAQIALSEQVEPVLWPREGAPLRVGLKHRFPSVADSEEGFIADKEDDRSWLSLDRTGGRGGQSS